MLDKSNHPICRFKKINFVFFNFTYLQFYCVAMQHNAPCIICEVHLLRFDYVYIVVLIYSFV